MKKHPYIELLAPAGGPNQFKAALAAGADAIYCGVGNDFNARRSADNFTLDSFEAACREAHLAGVRVYVTLNVVIKQDEMQRAMQLVYDCAMRGADAFIIQDWGLLSLIHQTWPYIDLHLSTQANVHNAGALCKAAAYGVSRITLSRELSWGEIASIAEAAQQHDIKLEVFGHGALCFCYSGVCQLSSFLGGRSANRGMCAQPCRMLYDLVDSEGNTINAPERTRPLCPKDACTIEDIGALIAAGASALKIEGRMKAPDYVYNVVSAYRQQIDAFYESLAKAPDTFVPELGSTIASTDVKRQLKRAFNRDFTDAYLHGASGDELMSYERSNNRGELVGEVIACIGGQEQRRDGKGNLHKDPRQNKHRAICKARIQLSEPVGAGDLLELRSQESYDDFITATVPEDAVAGQTIEVKLSRVMPKGAAVRVIRSKAAHTATAAALAQEHPRKREVAVRITARIGQPFTVELATITGPLAKAAVAGFTVEPARTKAVTREELIEHVGRMGTTPFEPAFFVIDLDEGAGMSFSAVHSVRAEACDALEFEIIVPSIRRHQNLKTQAFELPGLNVPFENSLEPRFKDPLLCVLVTNQETARAARDAGADFIYAPEEKIDEVLDALPDFVRGDSLDEFPGSRVVMLCDEVSRRQFDDPMLEQSWPYDADYTCFGETTHGGQIQPAVSVGNIADLTEASECYFCDVRSTIPIHNVWAWRALMEAPGAYGASKTLFGHFWLSPELSLEEIKQLRVHTPLTECSMGLVVYGRPRVMTSEHCVLQAANRCIHDCAHCKLRAQAEAKGISLKTKDGKLLPVRTDINGRSRIYGPEVLDLIPEVGELVLNTTVRYFGIDATLLTPEQTRTAIERLKNALENPEIKQSREPGATTGHFYDPIV